MHDKLLNNVPMDDISCESSVSSFPILAQCWVKSIDKLAICVFGLNTKKHLMKLIEINSVACLKGIETKVNTHSKIRESYSFVLSDDVYINDISPPENIRFTNTPANACKIFFVIDFRCVHFISQSNNLPMVQLRQSTWLNHFLIWCLKRLNGLNGIELLQKIIFISTVANRSESNSTELPGIT